MHPSAWGDQEPVFNSSADEASRDCGFSGKCCLRGRKAHKSKARCQVPSRCQ